MLGFYIPKDYDKTEAILDLKWAKSLDWCYQPDKAWRILTTVVSFIVTDEAEVEREVVTYDEKVHIEIVEKEKRNYSSVFQHSPAQQEAPEKTEEAANGS